MDKCSGDCGSLRFFDAVCSDACDRLELDRFEFECFDDWWSERGGYTDDDSDMEENEAVSDEASD